MPILAAPNEPSQDTYAAADLQKLGYKQEMTRARISVVGSSTCCSVSHSSPISTAQASYDGTVTLAIMAVPYGLAAPIATSLIGGGPATIIWGWVLVSALTLPLAFSLGEICAKYPTSAGAYYWCFRLAPPNHRLLVSWINGWLTMVGVWTISLSVTFGTAQLIVAGAGIYVPNWEVKPWQTYLIFLAVTGVAVLFCVFFNSILPKIDVISAYWTLIGVIVILVATSVKAEAGRHPAAFALGHFDPSPSGMDSGLGFFHWTPSGLFKVKSPVDCVIECKTLEAYTFSAIGMIASMAEEVHDPSRDLPRAITWSIPIGFLTGVVFLVPLLFTLPDISILLSGKSPSLAVDFRLSPVVASGQPIGVMFELIMGSKGGGFGLVCCGSSYLALAYSAQYPSRVPPLARRGRLRRDGAIPFPLIFARVNSRLGGGGGVPLNAILLSTTIQLLLGLIYLGSSAAFNAFVGVAVMCLGASYAMPVAISLYSGRKEVQDSPFGLGKKMGTVLNAIAVLWAAFEIVLFSMPAVVPVTRVTMNYASVVFVGFGFISAVWYIFGGRHHYKGPPLPAEEAQADSPSHSTKMD
ncbi:Amino acid transporter [Mycena indigotica]|uniref:Amino acid transporter n=1 Tax=Mycena indigotica TaxID=2126181 RepID=A0A8H6SDB6_9AGAR|nr:Amino acid transporter [Mycena indigotica]KAF7297440.1 Amino acid transporter [Mycena indigotica]